MLLVATQALQAQDNYGFWERVRFGGALGAGFGSGYTNISVAPMAIYEFNQYVGAGLGLQGSYVKDNSNLARYTSFLYGGSVIGIINPIEELQLSAEVEQLRVNLDADDSISGPYKDNFWNTALFLGAGYRAGSVIAGVRYNVLFDDNDFVYSTAFMPFVRLYF
ncbi:hypothetical protein [Flavobacterium cyanobacteriorum]|nr:hypothetical protein [Flavobacterium cyanobacteriorum]